MCSSWKPQTYSFCCFFFLICWKLLFSFDQHGSALLPIYSSFLQSDYDSEHPLHSEGCFGFAAQSRCCTAFDRGSCPCCRLPGSPGLQLCSRFSDLGRRETCTIDCVEDGKRHAVPAHIHWSGLPTSNCTWRGRTWHTTSPRSLPPLVGDVAWAMPAATKG